MIGIGFCDSKHSCRVAFFSHCFIPPNRAKSSEGLIRQLSCCSATDVMWREQALFL